MKIPCRVCGRHLNHDITNFPRSGKTGLMRRCWDCTREYDRQRWRSAERKKKHREGCRRRYAANPAAAREKHKEWRDANPDKVRDLWERNYERNGARRRQKNKRWRDLNPELRRTYRRNRRARELNAAGSHSADDVKAIKRRQRWKCFYCGTAPIQEMDHYIPLSKGGDNWSTNLRGACRSCNRRKSEKLPWDWQPDKFSKPDDWID